MGRDYYSVETGVREIAAAMRSERKCRLFSSPEFRRVREWNRQHYLRQAEEGVLVQLRKETIDCDAIATYLSNFRRYPEIRHYAAEILYRAYPDTARISRRRQLLINQLNAVIREFKEAK